MHLSSLLLLLSVFECGLWVDARGLPGGWEKTMFIIVRVIDDLRIANLGSKWDGRYKIAPACKRPCDDNALIRDMIDDANKAKLPNVFEPGFKGLPSDLPATAEKFDAQGWTKGNYIFGRIWANAGTLPEVFEGIGKFVDGNAATIAKLNPDVLPALQNSVLGTLRSRQTTSAEWMRDTFKEDKKRKNLFNLDDGIDVVLKERPMWKGSSETYKEIDWTATLQANKDKLGWKGDSRTDIGSQKAQLKAWAKEYMPEDEGHSLNNIALKQVAKQVGCKVEAVANPRARAARRSDDQENEADRIPAAGVIAHTGQSWHDLIAVAWS
jgi:hypothetical protein